MEKLTIRKRVSRRGGMWAALALAGLLSLLLPASALAAPETTITGGPADGQTITDPTPTFTFSSEDLLATFECSVDESAFAACGGPLDNSYTTAELPDGAHTFAVRAVSLLNGTDDTPAARTFTVDTTPPDTTIDGGPTDPTGDDTPTFEFSSTGGATFECRVGTGTFAPCSSPHTLASLPDGPYTFQVRALDAAGNPDPTPASRSFTVDTSGPDTTIDSAPTSPTNDSTPTFDFSSDDGGTFECRVDTGTFAPCSSPHTLASLPDGSYTFEVRALDAAGNPDPTPASQGFVVDTTDPVTQITGGPVGVTTPDAMPTFSFAAVDATATTFQCRIDGNAFGPCSGPGSHTPGIPLDDGAHTFEVRAIDAAGNRDGNPAIANFTVDTTGPETTIDSGPVGTISDQTPSFTFSASEPGSSFECRIDSGPFGACSGPGRSHTTGSLSDGEHSFGVRAVDPVGNPDPTPAMQPFTVDTSLPPDTTAPDTSITKRPASKIKTKRKKAKVNVGFRSEEGAAFTCKLDKGKYVPCTSPYRVKARAKAGKGKKHSVSIRATDSAGNTGDPEVVSFRVQYIPRLQGSRAERTVAVALKRHGYARRVVKALRADCHRKSRTSFGCKFSSRFRGYRLKGSGEVKLRAKLSYRFRVKAQGVRFTLTDKNEKG